MKKNLLSSWRGFTLIELLIVIAIIGILASIVVGSLSGARDNARIAAGESFDSSTYHGVGDHLEGQWLFETGSGSTAKDTSGFNRDATFNGSITWSTDTYNSHSDYSLQFTGTDYLQIPTALNISNSDFTFTEWIKTTATANQVYTIGNTNGATGYRFGIWAGQVAFLIGNGAGSYTESRCGTQTVNDGKWHHIAGVFDRSNLHFYCYIDGKIAGDVVLGNFYPNMFDSPGRIGKPSCCNSFVGALDDVRIYSSVLTVAQIEKIYAEGKPSHLLAEVFP